MRGLLVFTVFLATGGAVMPSISPGQNATTQIDNIRVAANEWHTLGLRAKDERFTISFDGKQLFAAEDHTFAGPRKVALWTKADSLTHFDSIAIPPLE